MDDRGPKVDRSLSEQSRFLRYCIDREITVTVFMSSGLSFMGIPRAFDKKSLLLGYRNAEKIPKLINTAFVTMIRADSILSLREEHHSDEAAIYRLRRRARRQGGQSELGPEKV
jgi:hypothetical protein